MGMILTTDEQPGREDGFPDRPGAVAAIPENDRDNLEAIRPPLETGEARIAEPEIAPPPLPSRLAGESQISAEPENDAADPEIGDREGDKAGGGNKDGDDADPGDGDEAGDEVETAAGDPALPLPGVVEAILFAAREPLKLSRIARAVGKGTRQEAVRAAIDELNVFYLDSGRAFEIAEISGCFQLLSRQEYIEHIRRIHPRRETRDSEPTVRLSQSALETLAIIAYRQPVTRADIERIRGVGCDAVLRLLMERGAVAAVGKKLDVVGQPRLYGTTVAVLAEFGLGSLDELPLREDFIRQLAETDGQTASIPGQASN
jgi:segregation and condensation protein B